MRIALLNPSYWPEVRRGSERVVHDLALELHRRGHDVTILTSHPGRPTISIEEGVRVVRDWRAPQLPVLRRLEHYVNNVPNVIRRLLQGRFDLAHAFFLTDAWAASKARQFGGPAVVFSFHGIPDRPYLVHRRHRLEMMVEAVRGASACTVLSAAAAEPFERYLLHKPRVVPPGVFCSDFAVDEPRAESPTLLCAASLGDSRKRGDLLASAFRALRAKNHEMRLLVVRTPDPVHSDVGEPTLPVGAEWIDASATPELAGAYARAWASVLPAVDEAFGLVLVESLAAGTPVVAARSGAAPEILGGAPVGVLFEPDDEAGLVSAMERALELGAQAGMADACRVHARQYDWETAVTAYEDVYESVLPASSERDSSSVIAGS